MVLTVYVAAVAMLWTLTLFSFLHRGAIFRGAANSEGFLNPADTPTAGGRARRARRRENAIRTGFALLVLVPPTWFTYRELAQQEAVRGSLRGGTAPPTSAAVAEAVAAVVVGSRQYANTSDGDGESASIVEHVWGELLASLHALLPHCGHVDAQASTLATHTMNLRWPALVQSLLFGIPRIALRLLRALDGLVARELLRIPVLPSATTFLLLAGVLYALYIPFCFLDHRESDPAIRRHSDSWPNRLVNAVKFRVARPIVNALCTAVRDYFSIELVAAYGPLPMFVFPAEANAAALSAAHRGHAPRPMAGRRTSRKRVSAAADGVRGAPGHPYTYHRRHHGKATMAHSPHSLPGSPAGSSSSEDDWDAAEMQQLHMQAVTSQWRTGDLARSSTPPGGLSSAPDKGMRSTTEASTFALPAVTPTSPPPPSRPPAALSYKHADEGLPCAMPRERASGRAGGAPPALTADALRAHTGQTVDGCEGAGVPCEECSTSEASPQGTSRTTVAAAPTPTGKDTLSRTATATVGPSPTPVVECAQYFFAAHPHGILPVCALVSLVSNVMGRERTLFVDNRGFPAAAAAARASPHTGPVQGASPQRDRPSLGAGDTPPPITQMSFAQTSIGASASATRSPTPAAFTSPCASFTCTNTRRMEAPSPVLTPAAAAAAMSFPSRSPTLGAALGPPSPPLAQPLAAATTRSPERVSTGGTTPGASCAEPHYAQALHYIYNRQLERFVLQGGRDEAVPPPGLHPTSELWPPLGFFQARLRAVVATFPFSIPVMRELYMLHGLLDASYATCKRVLRYNNHTFRSLLNRLRGHGPSTTGEGALAPVQEAGSKATSGHDGADGTTGLAHTLNHLLLFPGGASEALLSTSHGPTRLLLRRRRGFLRLTIQTRSGLVPVFTFGETDYYDQYSTTSSRFAAPLEDDDSHYIPNGEAPPVGAAADTNACSRSPLGGTGLPVGRSPTPTGTGASYYAKVIPSSTDDEASSVFSCSASVAAGPTTSAWELPGVPRSPTRAEQRMLLNDLHRRREAYRARHASTAAGAEGKGGSPTSARAGRRLPRWLQAVQRVFQQIFGISLPFVRNVLPKRGVKAMTVVGRPIYFELPPDLRRMYDDPRTFYDKEVERPILAAAQQVYITELKGLFNKYAPAYYADHSRRKLIII